MGRSDMCQTGKYRERGIRGWDGYQTEFVVDQEQYIIPVPAELEAVGVLSEPLSVVEKPSMKPSAYSSRIAPTPLLRRIGPTDAAA